MKSLRIGLLGLGTVGSGVVRLLAGNRDLVERKSGVAFGAVRALVRDPWRARDLGDGAVEMTTDPDAILAAPDIDLVVEVMGGTDPAREYIIRALRSGKPVVTANKDVIAEFGPEVYAAASAAGAGVYFEASVGGGIPILGPLQDSLAANHITAVLGIVNGTTNYILTQMTQQGKDFAAALAEAQELGYAEPDPTNDVDGLDAARKLAILAQLGFLTQATPADVYTEGIRSVHARDIEYGQRLGWICKLLAIGKQEDGTIQLRVHPTFIPRRHPLAHVHGSNNAIFVTGDAVGETMFYGRGAGAEPTASAILGDVIAAARGLRLRSYLTAAGGAAEMVREVAAAAWPGAAATGRGYGRKPVKPVGDVVTRYYLRMMVADRAGVLAKMAGAFGSTQVSIAHLFQTPFEAEGLAEIVVVTHAVAERQVQQCLALLRQVPEVGAIESLIRIEE